MGTFNKLIDWNKEIEPFRALGNDAQSSGGKYERFLENIIEKHLDLGTAAMKVRDFQKYKLKTICHGDPWFNNMMFKYRKDKKLDDIIFIDFQLSGYTSPALDLVYFLAASTTGELRTKYLSHILTLYHTIFVNTVQRFGVSVDFSYEDLLEDFSKARLHGLNFAIGALPSILAEKKEDIIDMDDWAGAMNIEDEETRNQKMKEVLDHQNASFDGNAAVKSRIGGLVDEWIDSADLLEGL